MSLCRSALVLAVLMALSAVVAAPANAATVPKVPKVKTRIAKVQIKISGHVETRQLHDTASDCFPGERWIQTNRYDFSTRGFVNISMKRVTGDGFDPIVTSPFSKSAGSAKVAGKITEYKTTNYCGSEPGKVAPAPTCGSTTGTTSISMQEGVLPNVDDGDLQPLTQSPLMLAIQRNGGARDLDGCLGPGAGRVTGKDTQTAVVSTSPAPGVALVIPSGLSVMKVFNIRPGQQLRRINIITGPCANVQLSTLRPPVASPPDLNLNADGDCILDGKIDYTITPRPKKR